VRNPVCTKSVDLKGKSDSKVWKFSEGWGLRKTRRRSAGWCQPARVKLKKEIKERCLGKPSGRLSHFVEKGQKNHGRTNFKKRDSGKTGRNCEEGGKIRSRGSEGIGGRRESGNLATQADTVSHLKSDRGARMRNKEQMLSNGHSSPV